MEPVLFAILTALCWSIGAFFEKKGMLLAGITPLMGIAIRTAIALVILGLCSYPHWHTLSNLNLKSGLYLVLGGGVLAGALGMLFFYTAIGTGQLSRVMPVAFGMTPLVGFLIGALFLREPVSALKVLGAIMVSAGVVLITRP